MKVISSCFARAVLPLVFMGQITAGRVFVSNVGTAKPTLFKDDCLGHNESSNADDNHHVCEKHCFVMYGACERACFDADGPEYNLALVACVNRCDDGHKQCREHCKVSCYTIFEEDCLGHTGGDDTEADYKECAKECDFEYDTSLTEFQQCHRHCRETCEHTATEPPTRDPAYIEDCLGYNGGVDPIIDREKCFRACEDHETPTHQCHSHCADTCK